MNRFLAALAALTCALAPTAFAAPPVSITDTANQYAVAVTSAGEAKVDCTTGCAGGSASNASSGVATSSTNGTTNAWMYGFNGTTWDQLQVDGSKYLDVDIKAGSAGNTAASATGSAVPANADYTGLNFGGSLKGWVGDTNGYGDVNVENTPAVTCAACMPSTGGTVGLVAGSAIIGNVGIDQTTPGTTNGVQVLTGSTTAVTQATAANLNATVVGTGTFAAQVTCSACASATNQTNVYAAAGTGTTDALGVQGPTAVASAFAANPLPGGGLASSSEPAAATTGHPVANFLDLAGKEITSPYANRGSMVRGSATGTDTSAHTIIAAGGASVKTYITNVQCGRTDAGTTAIYVTLSDAASTILVLPDNGGGGGNNAAFAIPLATAANTAFSFTASANITTVYCSAQGFSGY